MESAVESERITTVRVLRKRMFLFPVSLSRIELSSVGLIRSPYYYSSFSSTLAAPLMSDS